jgi:hypothetical protein
MSDRTCFADDGVCRKGCAGNAPCAASSQRTPCGRIRSALAYYDACQATRIAVRFEDDTELDLPISDFLAWLKRTWHASEMAAPSGDKSSEPHWTMPELIRDLESGDYLYLTPKMARDLATMLREAPSMEPSATRATKEMAAIRWLVEQDWPADYPWPAEHKEAIENALTDSRGDHG